MKNSKTNLKIDTNNTFRNEKYNYWNTCLISRLNRLGRSKDRTSELEGKYEKIAQNVAHRHIKTENMKG